MQRMAEEHILLEYLQFQQRMAGQQEKYRFCYLTVESIESFWDSSDYYSIHLDYHSIYFDYYSIT